MNVLARARGLQERIRPVYTRFQVKKRATFAPLKGERNTRPGVKKSSWSAMDRTGQLSFLTSYQGGGGSASFPLPHIKGLSAFVSSLVALFRALFHLTAKDKEATPPPPSSVEEQRELQISFNDLRLLLQPKFPKAQIMLLDRQYYYATMKKWKEIFSNVLLNMPKYTVDSFDCENFAFLTTSRVNERYHLNTCGIAIGMGWAHSFNVFIADDGVHTLEPETGEVDTYNIVEFLIMG
jgi:hypothetical protein